LGLAAFQFYRCRREFRSWLRTFRANTDIKALAIIALLTAIIHSVVPIQQGLDRYYGKAGLDFYPYTLLAQYLMDESYNTETSQFGLRPSALFTDAYKHWRIGQSIIQAEVSVFSQTNAQSGFAATIVLFLTALAICSYGILREMEVPRLTAAAGALLPTIFQAITRLSIDAYLSQTSTLFVFVFLTYLLLRQDLNARTFTLFFSLSLAYLISAYSELMPFGCAALILGIAFVRQDSFRTKRLTLFGAVLLVVLVNPFYIPDLISFLAQQYLTVTGSTGLNSLMPGVLTWRGWSEALFGVMPDRVAPIVEICAIAFVFLAVPGIILLKQSQRLAFGAVLLPFVALAIYLTTRRPLPVYPLTKLIFSYLPLISALALAAIGKLAFPRMDRLTTACRATLLLFMIAVVARGSIQEYQKSCNDKDLIESHYLRDPAFLDVCRQLEAVKTKKVLLFETNRALFFWLCYHARNNDVFTIFDQQIFLRSQTEKYAFSEIPKFEDVDLVVTHNQIIDTKGSRDVCLAMIDRSKAELRENGERFFWLGPQTTKVYFLGSKSVTANMRMCLSPGPEAKNLSVQFSIYQGQANIFNGEIDRQTTSFAQLRIPQGVSEIEIRASGLATEREPSDSNEYLVKLDSLDITETEPLAKRP